MKNKTEGRRVTIEEARRAPRCMIHWHPESDLPENQQVRRDPMAGKEVKICRPIPVSQELAEADLTGPGRLTLLK